MLGRVLRFLLRDAKTRDSCGEFLVSQGRWAIGDVFKTGEGLRLRIIDMREDRERNDVAGVWMVEPAETKSGHTGRTRSSRKVDRSTSSR